LSLCGGVDFGLLVGVLRHFSLVCAPYREVELEVGLECFLRVHGFGVERQVVCGCDRFDLVVGTVIIEVKLNAQKNIVEQLDRYSAANCTGLIVVCWRASQPLKRIFAKAKTSAEIPVELIEIIRNCEVV